MSKSTETMLAVIAFGAILFMMYYYGSNKSVSGMTGSSLGGGSQPPDMFSSTAAEAPPSCSKADPSLLPKDSNSAWAQNAGGNGPLSGISFLKAGALVGIDTVGSTLRNANLQLRSEVPNPRIATGPWNQSTIESNPVYPCFEIGKSGGC
jgi:hypothetical protein